MRTLFLLVFLFSPKAFATDSYEVIGGALTYHLIDFDGAAQSYASQLSPDGRLINNTMFGLQYTDETDKEYESYTLFGGQNSVGSPMLGFKYSTGYKVSNFYIGFVAGLYEQSTASFTDLGIQPFQIASIGDVGIVPVLGLEVNYRIDLWKDHYLKLNNVITPILTNTTLSLGVSY